MNDFTFLKIKRISLYLCNAILAGILLASCSDANLPESEAGNRTASSITVAKDDIKVTRVHKISETRISRTVFEYVFSVSFQNTSNEGRDNISATVVGAGAGTTIIDGTVSMVSLGAGESQTPSDTIRLRHDRSMQFNPNALVWNITASTDVSSPGSLVNGPPDARAIEYIQEYFADLKEADFGSALDPDSGAEYYETQLLATVNSTATVAQVNAALTNAGARIAASRLNNPTITLIVPKQADPARLKALVDALEASKAFQAVGLLAIPKPNALPEKVSPSEAMTYGGPVFHHIAAGFGAAWPSPAAIQTMSEEVEIIIVDYFGHSAPATLQANLVAPIDGIKMVKPNDHGYHVLGIIGADFGSDGGAVEASGKITGAMPVPVPLHAIDLAYDVKSVYAIFDDAGEMKLVNWFEFTLNEMRRIFRKNLHKRYVVNLSIGYCNGTAASNPKCDVKPIETITSDALGWRNRTRELSTTPHGKTMFDYEGKVIQVSAAGNNAGRQARLASMFNAAVLIGDIPDPTSPGAASRNLRNGLVVENRAVTAEARPHCLYQNVEFGSNSGGNIAAIGTGVSSFGAPEAGVLPTVVMTGTSMAAPQVTGLVAWMLATRNEMAPEVVHDTLSNNSYRPSSGAADPCPGAPMIDASAAMLALDTDNGGALVDADVRLARLRPTAAMPASSFTFGDAQGFLRQIFPSAYGALPQTTGAPTFSEYDLNGDGYVSDASRRARFNLKYEASVGVVPTYGVVKSYPSGLPISLDERSVSDFEVLCYYANSSLFADGELQKFNNELARITPLMGRPISCTVPAVTLRVQTTNPAWEGLPANILLSNFTPMNKILFSINGSPGNTCLSGERGSPIYSSQVDPAAVFNAVSTVVGLPTNIGGAGINRRPCSSFYAIRAYGPDLEPQVWINATGRGQTFGATSRDWEIQVRYSNGDPRDAFRLGRQCEVGVVPNGGFFGKSFDAVCTHASTISQ